jgi:tRNA G18 (ribose-2'-O)-methylase SpoU
MPQIRLENLTDPRVDEYRGIGDRDLVRRRGVFVAEGRLVVERVLADDRWTVRSLLLSEAAREALRPALSNLSAHVPVYVCHTADFLRLTGFNIHRGCLALVDVPPPRSAEDLLQEARRVVVLEDVANADNIGGIFRNAAAFAVDALLLSPTCSDPFYRKAVRTSMAAVLAVRFARVAPWPGGLAVLRACGFTVVGLTPERRAESLHAFVRRPPADRLAVVLGAEGTGLTSAGEAFVDVRVRIPISATVDSLNVAVAAGIALSCLGGVRAS